MFLSSGPGTLDEYVLLVNPDRPRIDWHRCQFDICIFDPRELQRVRFSERRDGPQSDETAFHGGLTVRDRGEQQILAREPATMHCH